MKKILGGKIHFEKKKPSAKDEAWEQDPYGMNYVDSVLQSNDFGWRIDESFTRRVFLTNPKEVEGRRVTVSHLANRFVGTGYKEWEVLLAYWLLNACYRDLEDGYDTAEITCLFDKRFTSSSKEMKVEELYEHVIPQFEIVRKTENELYLKLKF